MNENKDKAIDFYKKLKEKLGRDLKQEIDNGEYDKLIDYILKTYNEGLNVFYEEGIKEFFDKFAKTNDKNLSSIIGILDSQRETITNLNKKIQNQEKRIAKLEKEIENLKTLEIKGLINEVDIPYEELVKMIKELKN